MPTVLGFILARLLFTYHLYMYAASLLLMSVFSWLLVFLTGYLRDICQIALISSYVLCIFAVSVSLILIYTFDFEFSLANMDFGRRFRSLELGKGDKNIEPLPSYVGSMSRNGLTYIIVSNLLTIIVNVFLNPRKGSSFECFVIMSVYMLIRVEMVFILLMKRIRIA